MNINTRQDLLCFSHLRWDFVFQRPQHLMTRFANGGRVYFLEEPIYGAAKEPQLHYEQKAPGLWLCVPHLPDGTTADESVTMMESLLATFFETRDCSQFVFWYYTPMALEFSASFTPAMVVYDCMDELSAFKFAPSKMKDREEQLFALADIVFTGGVSLYEAKKTSHKNIHPFPSSIEKEHFRQARKALVEPADQAGIAGLKLGFYGVIDERFDQQLIREIAAARPDWQIILIGPVVKIDPEKLPRAENIHYLGAKSYQQLPAYLSGWDVALIPFLLNESTRFISPTKTPEYLASGRPVVSTAITDVIDPYRDLGLVSIGSCPDSFISAIEYEVGHLGSREWLETVDAFLADKSWADTFQAMQTLMNETANRKKRVILNSELKNAS